ncbi:MAG: biopolymer transporter ExbD [Brevinematales bacterium]|nr:biopolymer transporter ExbD [Brevinematales bacterium]
MKRMRKKIKSEINITPLTDVSLMLLSIFLITTPMMVQSGLNIELPKLKNVEKNFHNKNIELNIDNNGNIFIDNKRLNLINLEDELKQKIKDTNETIIFIKADKNIKYELLMKVIDTSKKAGVKKIALGVEIDN